MKALLRITCAALGLASCGRESRVTESNLSYIATYEQSGKSRKAASWISVTTRQNYSLVPRGWAGLNCTVDAAAIEIPANGGNIYVLLPENGFTIGARIRDVHTKLFKLPYADDKGEWAQHWNDFKGSRRTVDLPTDMQPDFLFIPTRGSALEAQLVTAEQLSDYGIKLQKLTMQESAEIQKTIPANLQAALNFPIWDGPPRENPDRYSAQLLVRKAIT